MKEKTNINLDYVWTDLKRTLSGYDIFITGRTQKGAGALHTIKATNLNDYDLLDLIEKYKTILQVKITEIQEKLDEIKK